MNNLLAYSSLPKNTSQYFSTSYKNNQLISSFTYLASNTFTRRFALKNKILIFVILLLIYIC